jgi:hypothetical protein
MYADVTELIRNFGAVRHNYALIFKSGGTEYIVHVSDLPHVKIDSDKDKFYIEVGNADEMDRKMRELAERLYSLRERVNEMEKERKLILDSILNSNNHK